MMEKMEFERMRLNVEEDEKILSLIEQQYGQDEKFKERIEQGKIDLEKRKETLSIVEAQFKDLERLEAENQHLLAEIKRNNSL